MFVVEVEPLVLVVGTGVGVAAALDDVELMAGGVMLDVTAGAVEAEDEFAEVEAAGAEDEDGAGAGAGAEEPEAEDEVATAVAVVAGMVRVWPFFRLVASLRLLSFTTS